MMFIVLSSMAKPLREITRVTWMNVSQCQAARRDLRMLVGCYAPVIYRSPFINHLSLANDNRAYVCKLGKNTIELYQDDVYGGKAIVRIHSGHLNECRSAPGGCQLMDQAARCDLSMSVGCYGPVVHQSPFISNCLEIYCYTKAASSDISVIKSWNWWKKGAILCMRWGKFGRSRNHIIQQLG